MCGFTGFIGNYHPEKSRKILQKMSSTIVHRGPDDEGYYSIDDLGVNMSFRRLAILDLTQSGHQPMCSHSGRYIISFNGEIYNYQSLRNQLNKEFAGITWQGSSDTEVLLCLIERHGLTKALTKCIGMFAVALFDKKLQKMYFARDRFGEKPLYYGWVEDNFVYGSELSSIKKFPRFQKIICKKALGLYLNYSYVPAPMCIYENIFKVEPGQIISLPVAIAEQKNIKSEFYWIRKKEIINAKNNLFSSYEEGLSTLSQALRESVELQMISDVPLGAFLSGGIDSSLIVSMMQENSINPIKTFTIGFEDKEFDESPFAKSIAKHLQTDHTEVILDEQDAIDVIPIIPEIYSEPFADSSQIPTFLVSKIAKLNVTVSLSGDGGDELFGGYNRYFWGKKIWSKISWAPFVVRNLTGKILHSVPSGLYNQMESVLNTSAKGKGIHSLAGKVKRLSQKLQYIDSTQSLYTSLCTEWNDVNSILDESYHNSDNSQLKFKTTEALSDIENMMQWDLESYLKEDILTKVDRAAMANSLETRAPFLDLGVANAAWRMPEAFLVSDFQGKLPLKSLLERYVPRELFERPKAGFGIPIGQWLKGPLHEWASELLAEKALTEEGIFNAAAVSRIWGDHNSGAADNTVKLWNILMFRSWMQNGG
jgi:asparagine synthase (glutamine-hydrolysing)